MKHYLEIIDVRLGGSKTGKGAVYTNAKDARKAFRAVKEIPDADFLLDLHIGGDLVDTKHIDAATFERLTGAPPKSAEEYADTDRANWLAAYKAHLSSLT